MRFRRGSGHAADPLDEGQWLVTHLDQVIVSFFLPLAEPLGIETGQGIATYLPMSKPAIDLLLSSGLDLAYAPLHEANAPAVIRPADQIANQPESPLQNWANKCTLSSSLLVHQVTADPWARSGIDAVGVVAGVASGDRYQVGSTPLTTLDKPSDLPADLKKAGDLGVGQITVIEAAVPLRLIGNVQSFQYDEADAVDIVHQPVGPDQLPHSPDLWPFAPAEGSAMDSQRLAERVYWALGAAIGDVRNVQKAYHRVTRHPITLLTRERLPFILPVTFRRLADFGDPERAHRTLVQVNQNYWSLLQPSRLGATELEDLQWARSTVDDDVFSAHLDLHREADAALRRQGDSRVAVLLSAVAAESLLDELLLHMKWEEAQTPEEAAGGWTNGLATRVKREYAVRLGGQWDLAGGGPIGRWATAVAALRNRVVHGAYLPNIDEAQESLEAINGLVTYLCDRLAAPERLARYPRTALALAGETGLSRRGAFSKQIADLQRSSEEPHWRETFARWREAHNRLRRDVLDGLRVPDANSAFLLAVRREDGSLHWCLHDRATFLAAPVAITSDQIQARQRRALAQTLEQAAMSNRRSAMSMQIEREPGVPLEPCGAWREEYHLVPLAGVMVDRSDFTAPYERTTAARA